MGDPASTGAPEDGMAGFVLALARDVSDQLAEHDQRRALVLDHVRLDRADGRPWCCECPWCIDARREVVLDAIAREGIRLNPRS